MSFLLSRHLRSTENLVKCQQFVEKHCLAYCLMALSSRCGLLRAVVYNCLTRFEQHLHGNSRHSLLLI